MLDAFGPPRLITNVSLKAMHLASMTIQQLGGLAWNIFMAAAGFGLAITGPKYLHLIDKGFLEKSRKSPEAAAKQVKALRIVGALLGLCGLVLIYFGLVGTRK